MLYGGVIFLSFFHFFHLAFDDKADRANKTSFSLRLPLSLSRFPTPRATRQSLCRTLSEVAKQNSGNPALSVKHRSRTMAEPYDTRGARRRGLVASLDDDVPKFPVDNRPKTINDLPKELLVSVFESVDDLYWVRRTVPLVCKAWDELYRSQDASPLHETLEVDLLKEALEAQKRFQDPSPFVRASRVISWVERRAGWVRKLFWKGEYPYYTKGFSAEDLGRLVAVAGSSLTELRIRCAQDRLLQKPFWDSLRDSVVPAGLLHSLVVMGPFVVASKFDVEPLGQLAGSLQELVLDNVFNYCGGLRRFPESFCALTELRCLEMFGHDRMTAISAQLSSLKKARNGQPRPLRHFFAAQRAGRALGTDETRPRRQHESRVRAPRRGVPCGAREAEVSASPRPLPLRPPHRPIVRRRAAVARAPRPLRQRRADLRHARHPDRGLPLPASGQAV